MDASIIAAIIGAVATILAVLVSGLLSRKKGGSAQKDESKSPQAVAPKTEIEAKKFARRYLDYPSNYRFMWALPKMKAVVLENAQQGWDTGVTSDMRDASYDVIDFLEYSWLRLAEFYPDDHWGGKDAKAYIRDYIQERFTFHWSKHEPDGPSTGGTIVGILTGSDVINDLENLIVDMVSALFMYKDDFDFAAWKEAWEAKKSKHNKINTADR